VVPALLLVVPTLLLLLLLRLSRPLHPLELLLA
jgi:hypothetical protein